MSGNAVKGFKNNVLLLFFVTAAAVGPVTGAFAQSKAAIGAALEQALADGADNSIKISYLDKNAVKSFYEARGYAPVWTGGGRVEGLAALFEQSWTHGLNPASYHPDELRDKAAGGDAAQAAALELLATDAAMRYGHDLTGMRADPAALRQKASYWRKPMDGAAVMAAVTAGGDPVRALAGLAPDTALYNALRRELVRLSTEREDYERVLPLNFGGSAVFKPGARSRDVAGLRVRLGISHDPAAGPEDVYDDQTAAAVMAFQRENGLEPDGVIGPQTRAVLNRSSKDRMEQIVANLERLRWLPQDRPERYLLVNIAQQLLWAVDDGKVVDEIKVVVGMVSRKTKDFTAEVTGVRFNPTWTVPLNLKMNDFLPKLRRDPEYLSQSGIEIIRGSGSEARTLDPTAVNWDGVDRGEMNRMRFVQRAGAHNALGSVRILMANDYDIYMHDTNHPEFFEREQRTYSSGCIRLSEPKKVADFVLSRNEGWSEEEMEELIARGRTVEVKAVTPFPVYIIYQTAWLDNAGRLVFGADVYNRDRELLAVLKRADGYVLPDPAQERVAEAGKGASRL